MLQQQQQHCDSFRRGRTRKGKVTLALKKLLRHQTDRQTEERQTVVSLRTHHLGFENLLENFYLFLSLCKSKEFIILKHCIISLLSFF
jgi:hypothetical protein